MPLTDLALRPEYDPDICPDVVGEFYAPALAQSVAYDRCTFTFTAAGLVAAAAGLAGLLRNDGRVRVICDLENLRPDVQRAILDGQSQALLDAVPPEDLTRVDESDIRAKGQLDIITWLVAQGRLEIRVAISARRGIFHSKTGVMRDAAGNSIAFDGSPNETDAGWSRNYERFDLFKSWEESARVKSKAEHFARLWNGKSKSVRVIPIPDAYAEHLIAAAPPRNPALPAAAPDAAPAAAANAVRRAEYWRGIRAALRDDPASTLATIPAKLWPHQTAFFWRHAPSAAPDRLLIADEVGLGKTIQAGSLLKARINQGRASRFLILAPRHACPQWQEELRRKFNISVPILSAGGKLTLAYPDGAEAAAPNPPWDADALIMSYQWLRRRKDDFLNSEPHYDMVIVDEAHRARFSEVANPRRRSPNQYLRLLRGLAERVPSLLLLTATPMQLHEAELRALLDLLQPSGWSDDDFRRFYDTDAPLDIDQWRFMARAYRPLSPNPSARDERLLRNDNPGYVAMRLGADPDEMARTAALMRERAPAKRLMSRHTRETLREYARQGRIEGVVPNRRVTPVPVAMNADERRLYDGIDDLVREAYSGALGGDSTALGFVMTTYRKRLGSSPRAFARTCRNHMERRQAAAAARNDPWRYFASLSGEELDDAPDDPLPLPPAPLPPSAMARLADAAAAADGLERRDSKLGELRSQLDALAAAGHRRIIVFTQFRDTMLYLAERLERSGYGGIVSLSGQDGPAQGSRAARLSAMRDADSGLLICTETASESLNLQFCSAMVNYDIPWNPMTLEQRIGRIDRIGQARASVDIVNLFCEGTAEWDAYEAMLERLGSIHGNVGEYQPILYDPASAGRLAAIIRQNTDRQATRAAVQSIDLSARFDLNALNSELTQAKRPAPAVDMADLRRPLTDPALMPDGWAVQNRGGGYWTVARPDGSRADAAVDADAHERADGVEWFGPGSAWWPG